jgi:anti-sigma regulatory factor (Ser/Thr protein kinase)
MRHALSAFLTTLDVDQTTIEDILMAVGETIANAVEHAYGNDEPGFVEMHARLEGEELLCVEVRDDGNFVERESQTGRGFGLRIVKTVAREVSVKVDRGTRVRMLFQVSVRVHEPAAKTGSVAATKSAAD